jgi:asparagine synthase (glutamine-hydrolysing)
MCGIAGVLQRDGRSIDGHALQAMGAAMAQRGPDGEGFFSDDGTPSAGLVSRRLAVIDIPGGAQPMSTEDGSHTIAYNGEIYNATELRRELESAGHRFRSRCDTEIVLRGYMEWGPGVLDRLNGMWACAIWSRRERTLFLSRDRLGIKPLVYADTPRGLVFASEIKALLASGLVERGLDLTALPHYLSWFVIPEPLTLFRGVRRLPAGHYLLADRAGTREVRYWDCAVEEEEDRGLEHYRDEVRGLLEDSVTRQLVSDVPLGVFLSSGIDSSLVAALAAKASRQPIRTFTLGFEGSVADERDAARRTAAALGADHSEEVIAATQAADALPDLLEAHGEPSQSLIQAHFVSRLARRRVTVALAGTGGDELFSSYPTHRVVDMLARIDRLPGILRGAVLQLAGHVPSRRGKRLAALAEMPADQRVTQRLLHQTDAALRRSLIHPQVVRSLDLGGPVRLLEENYARSPARHPLNRLLYVYVKTYLVDELLRTLDTMSMLHSLEVRVPLLDHRVVERAMAMPAHHKMSWREGKVLLRRAAETIVPQGATSGRKRGFSLPLDEWLHRALGERVRDTLAGPSLAQRGIFDLREVKRVLDRFSNGEARLQPTVMMLFTFEEWARRVLDDAPVISARGPVAEVRAAESAPELSVVIVNWNTQGLLRDCLASVARHLSAVPHEVLVVDNASSDGSPGMVASEFPRVRLIRNAENVGFARANNQAMREARGKWLLLLNSDTRLVDDSVARLFVIVRAEQDVGVAHCRLVFEDGRTQYSTYRFPSIGLTFLEGFGLYKLLPRARRGEVLLAGYWEQDHERDVDWVAGAFMLLRREVFERTDGFTEEYFMYGEDLEWCYRIRDAGWRIRYYPSAVVVHRDHASAEARWGSVGRVALCVQRRQAIFDRRYGPVRGAVFRAASVGAALFHLVYFATRGLLGGRNAEYYRDMRRHSSIVLQAQFGKRAP